MHIINKIKGITILLLFLAVSPSSIFAQEVQDSVQYSTDTTTVAVSTKIKGKSIKGNVIDGASNKPMNGARISIEGFSASITDEKGNFSITVPPYKATFQISAEGYHTKLVPSFEGKSVTVTIYPVNSPSLFETVNLPLGQKSLSRTTAAVTSVTPHGAWTANSETPDSYLQGKLSGVNVIRSSSTSSITAEMFIRGYNSLGGSNKPLFVVDGLIYDVNKYGNSLSSGHLNNPLQHIDLHDIENITVIKDAAAAAVYGSKAANGVVLISTNHAKELATKIDFAAYGGVNSTPGSYPLLNGEQHRTYLSDILRTRNFTAGAVSGLPYINADPSVNNQFYAYNNNTNWQNKVFKTSYDNNYYIRVSGGDNIAKYVLSAGYMKENGVIDTTSNTNYHTRFNADFNLTQKLTATANLSLSYSLQALKDQGIAARTNPIFASLVKSPLTDVNAINAFGERSPTLSGSDTLGLSNPVALLNLADNKKKNYRILGSTDFTYTFNKTFKLSALLGLTYDKLQESSFIPRLGVANDTLSNGMIADSRSATQAARFFGIQTDTRLAYSKVINKNHRINALAGFRYIDNENEQDYALGFNTGTDQLLSIGNTNSAGRVLNGNIGSSKSINSYLTADYSFQDRYLLNASIAVDGSSRFGRSINNTIAIGGNKLAVLPALGVAWIVSSEDFMRNLKKIDLLKLRFSYGLVGNDDINGAEGRSYYISQNLLGLQGLIRGNISNPYLQWEVVSKLNGGLDASFFNERLSLSVDVWQNKTTKMLTTTQIDFSQAGFSSYADNNASMKTSGVDLGVNTRILNGIVKWNAGVNIGTYKNKVLKLGTDAIYNEYADGTYITRAGQAANVFYGYKTDGVYSSDAEAAEDGLVIRRNNSDEFIPFGGGDIRFVNAENSDNIIDANDRVVIGNPNPDVFGSLNNKVNYKKWTLDALFTFVAGNDIYNYTRYQLEAGKNYYNQTAALLNRWRGEGQVTNTPKVSYGDPMGNSRFSDRWIEDGSYLRLRTLALTYSVPLKKGALKYFNIYGTASNVFTISKYLGYDPEFSASGSIYNQGVDVTMEPQVRSFQLGVRVGL